MASLSSPPRTRRSVRVLAACRLDVDVSTTVNADGTGEVVIVGVVDKDVVDRPGLAGSLVLDDATAAGWVVEGPAATETGGLTVTLRHRSTRAGSRQPGQQPRPTVQRHRLRALGERGRGRRHDGRARCHCPAARGTPFADQALLTSTGGTPFAAQLAESRAPTRPSRCRSSWPCACQATSRRRTAMSRRRRRVVGAARRLVARRVGSIGAARRRGSSGWAGPAGHRRPRAARRLVDRRHRARR